MRCKIATYGLVNHPGIGPYLLEKAKAASLLTRAERAASLRLGNGHAIGPDTAFASASFFCFASLDVSFVPAAETKAGISLHNLTLSLATFNVPENLLLFGPPTRQGSSLSTWMS